MAKRLRAWFRETFTPVGQIVVAGTLVLVMVGSGLLVATARGSRTELRPNLQIASATRAEGHQQADEQPAQEANAAVEPDVIPPSVANRLANGVAHAAAHIAATQSDSEKGVARLREQWADFETFTGCRVVQAKLFVYASEMGPEIAFALSEFRRMAAVQGSYAGQATEELTYVAKTTEGEKAENVVFAVAVACST